MVAVTVALASGCSGAPASPDTPGEPSVSLPGTDVAPAETPSRPTYAALGYALGVAPSSGHTPICPFEVATWDKSLLGSWTTISASVRGPAELSTTATLADGKTVTQRTSVTAQDSQSLVDLRDVQPGDAARIVIMVGDGPQGQGGACEVWRVNRDVPAGTGADLCKRKHWPLSIPKDVLGLRFSDADSSYRELSCFNVSSAISVEDGHDVNNDPVLDAMDWIIVGINPKTGTTVDADTVVNLRVRHMP